MWLLCCYWLTLGICFKSEDRLCCKRFEVFVWNFEVTRTTFSMTSPTACADQRPLMIWTWHHPISCNPVYFGLLEVSYVSRTESVVFCFRLQSFPSIRRKTRWEVTLKTNRWRENASGEQSGWTSSWNTTYRKWKVKLFYSTWTRRTQL